MQAYLLLTPWALFDVADTGRRPLSLEAPVKASAGVPLFLAAPAETSVDVDGRHLGAQRETNAFYLGHRRYQLHSLSVGTREEDSTMVVRLDNEVAGHIQIIGHLPRPSWSLGRDQSGPSGRQQMRLDLFLLGLVDLIRLVDDPAIVWRESGWERLSVAWTSGEINLSDPPMALIVRHAQTLQRLLNDLAHHPRHILSRFRRMTPVDQVQQLDIASVGWLSRQPGQTVYERAGPQQRILAVRRFENLDTLENRVLRDFAQRSHGLATAYSEQYRALRASRRWQRVDEYRRSCRRLARTLREAAIGLPRPPIIPNYALLQNQRYRRIWSAYRQIIRRLDEQDECWRWQHRLWADFCRLAVQVALRRSNKFEVIAESPLRIATEQQRGRWSLVDPHSGSFILRDKDDRPAAVLSVLWDTTAEHTKLAPWMAGLGATTVLHLQRLDDGRESYLLIWPLHLYGEDINDLKQIAESGQRAMERCLSGLKLAENVSIRAEGLVLVSNIHTGSQTPKAVFERADDVVAARLSAGYEGLRHDIHHLGDWIHTMAMRLVADKEQE